MLAVDQSSALQVETLGASLAIGGVREQIEPGDQCEETADTQQVDSDDGMDEDEQEDEYSSSDSRRPKVLHTPATRAAELTDRMKGGVHHNHIPVWRFEGRQVSTSGAKRDETKPVDDAEKSPALAASVGYHSTIRSCVEGEQQAAEVLHLFGHRGRSMKDLRYCILRLCFRELSVVSGDQWERNMGFFRYWRCG